MTLTRVLLDGSSNNPLTNKNTRSNTCKGNKRGIVYVYIAYLIDNVNCKYKNYNSDFSLRWMMQNIRCLISVTDIKNLIFCII